MIARMVLSIRAMPVWPLPARSAVSCATSTTSFIVLSSSREVAEICFEVAPISAVVAAISVVVLCCSREVAAIWVAVMLTCTPERCTRRRGRRDHRPTGSSHRAQQAEFVFAFQFDPLGEVAVAHAFDDIHELPSGMVTAVEAERMASHETTRMRTMPTEPTAPMVWERVSPSLRTSSN